MGRTETGLLERVDFFRIDANRKLNADRKAELGQFLTPAPVARLMASMLGEAGEEVRIIDPGAGVGSLFVACVAELCRRARKPRRIEVAAYEIDPTAAQYIPDTLRLCREACLTAGIEFEGQLICADFIAEAADQLGADLFGKVIRPSFTCAVLNPPYRKIRSDSEVRSALRRVGIETSNLYTGFLALAMRLLAAGGEMVAITPRSFCNGLYFRGFRKAFLKTMAIRQVHVFESRDQAFRDDDVLQENVIFRAVKDGSRSARVVVTSGAGPDDECPLSRVLDYSRVVRPGDPHAFIYITPDHIGEQVAVKMARLGATLADLGVQVSTGRVVDFRVRDYLRLDPGRGTVPLIYPTHCSPAGVEWPKTGSRKPNAIAVAERTAEWLVPNDHYVLVRRFSAKEEKRRVVASVYDPARVPGSRVGFENHLNYFHRNGVGLPAELARGLAAFLNSTVVDAFFRQFNGNTQVNATDLRSLRYPTPEQLQALGRQVRSEMPPQDDLDALIEHEVFAMGESEAFDPVRVKQRVDEALDVLRQLDFPRSQLNERSALTLLALLDLKPDAPWSAAGDPLCGITPMMEFFARHYGKTYKPNTRETVRRQTVHQFLDAGLIVVNPDDPLRPVNSPNVVYQIEPSALKLMRTFGKKVWEKSRRTYLSSVETLRRRYAQERQMARIPVAVAPGRTISLSPGGQNVLVQKIVEEFASRFTPGGTMIYVGDTDEKFAYFDEEALATLGVSVETHGKMPDVVIHYRTKDWLVLVEAVTSHGPIDPKRRGELRKLFRQSKAGLVFVTAFLTRKAMVEYLDSISWETEVWVAESPDHMIHFNGERFLGPYPE